MFALHCSFTHFVPRSLIICFCRSSRQPEQPRSVTVNFFSLRAAFSLCPITISCREGKRQRHRLTHTITHTITHLFTRAHAENSHTHHTHTLCLWHNTLNATTLSHCRCYCVCLCRSKWNITERHAERGDRKRQTALTRTRQKQISFHRQSCS